MGTSITTWASILNTIIDGSLGIGSPAPASPDNEALYMTAYKSKWDASGCSAS